MYLRRINDGIPDGTHICATDIPIERKFTKHYFYQLIPFFMFLKNSDLVKIFPVGSQNHRMPPNDRNAQPYIPRGGMCGYPNLSGYVPTDQLIDAIELLTFEFEYASDAFSVELDAMIRNPERLEKYKTSAKQLFRFDMATINQLRHYMQNYVSVTYEWPY